MISVIIYNNLKVIPISSNYNDTDTWQNLICAIMKHLHE